MADRILVMRKGSVVLEFVNEPVSKDRLMDVA
jgi:ABC-type sugar transport system ATPase subunit